ncbi:MAG: hypothetical protein VX267_02925, partial [Candidatus Thermoplasmatota archaeon]|nr:hypothetical protein [Candidatus Thermoplasmatota archaeon]
IVIRADLTESQKAGGEGDTDIDVELVLVQGVFMDDTRRKSLLGFKDQADAIDDNEFPPDYDRYTIRFPESGPSGYAAEGSYIGEIEFTVTARNESGGNLSQQQFWVNIGPDESEDTFELKLPTLPSLDTMLPILGIGLLLLLVSFGVWHFVLKPEEFELKKKEAYDPLKSTLTGVGIGSDMADDEDEEDEDEEEYDDDDENRPELSESEILASLTGELVATADEEDDDEGEAPAPPPAPEAAEPRKIAKKRKVAKKKTRKVRKKAKQPTGPPAPKESAPAPQGTPSASELHCPKDGTALQHWPNSGYDTDYFCPRCQEYVAPSEEHADDRRIDCPNCGRVHTVPVRSTKFICQCGRRIRLG